MLREELTRRGLYGFVVPLTDEHLSEYVGAYAKRLAWLTGFQGSAGTAVVLSSEAAIFVDRRYALQVRQQVDERHWSFESIMHTTVAAWLGEHAGEGARIGYHPWLHTREWIEVTRATLREKGAQLIAVDANPIDAVWLDRPAPSTAKIDVHPAKLAGRSSADKRWTIADWLVAGSADAAVLCAIDSIAWIFNVRGKDVDHTPVALAFALIHADGAADLFVAPGKLTDEVVAHIGPQVRLHPRDAFAGYLGTLANKKITVDPQRTVAAIFEALEAAGPK